MLSKIVGFIGLILVIIAAIPIIAYNALIFIITALPVILFFFVAYVWAVVKEKEMRK